ncbi:hypothetical protein SETIT_2G289800v2 [Setaria italica]|uniref:Uncharacterized protein n=1 Tax=Setaria italica TaxID=4555 RepID=A0A368Q4S8_SETIT|nr:hypothetical protein SETIT_2G289800v2 [Setaria italica]
MGAYVHAVFFFLSRKQLAARVLGTSQPHRLVFFIFSKNNNWPYLTAETKWQPVMRLTCSIKKERSTA